MLLLSSKGKNKYRFIFLIMGIAFLILSFIYSAEMSPPPYASEEEKMMFMIATCVIGGFGLLAILFSLIHCSGYIDIYDDHLEGKGLQGKGMNTFYLTKKQLRKVTQESYYLCLHTDVGTFKIICDKNSRNEIMKHCLNS